MASFKCSTMDKYSKKIKNIHQKLLTDISEEVTPNGQEHQSLKAHMKVYVRSGLLEGKSLLEQFDAVERKGHLKPGKYDTLKEICADSGNDSLLDLINKSEEQINALQTEELQTVADKPKCHKTGEITSYKIDDIAIVFEAEELLDMKIVHLSRKRDTKTHKIGVELNAIRSILNISQKVLQIIDKFGDGSVSFQKTYPINEELNLKIFSAGSTVQIDLRRYVRFNPSEEQKPMKAGITIPSHLFRMVVEKFQEILEKAESM